IFQALNFEHNTNVGRQIESLAVWQSKQLVVVEHTVQVFHPLWIDVAIKNNPVALAVFSTEIVNDLPQDTGEQSVRPFSSCAVKATVKCFFGHDLWVDHMVYAFNALHFLESLEQDSPDCGFARC